MNATTHQGISRRAALGGAAGAVVGAKVATEAEARPVRRRPVDVAVVGAGIAGLSAARMLAAEGANVAVVDAGPVVVVDPARCSDLSSPPQAIPRPATISVASAGARKGRGRISLV